MRLTPFYAVGFALSCFLGLQQTLAEKPEFLLVIEGSRITAEQAEALERSLENDPDDLAARTKLLAYYSLGRGGNTPAAKAARAKHVAWVIENCPDSSLAGAPYTTMTPGDGEGFYQAKELWLKQATRHAQNPAVLGNAANFLTLWERDAAEKFLKQAKELDPLNAEWPNDLAHLYQLDAQGAPTPEARREWAAKALAEQRRAVELAPDERDRMFYLTDLPEMAVDAGRLDEAKTAARRLIDPAGRHPDERNDRPAMHRGHIALGRVAARGRRGGGQAAPVGRGQDGS